MKFLSLLLIISIALLSGCYTTIKGDGCSIGYSKVKAGTCEKNESCLKNDKCIISGKCTYAQGICLATRPIDCNSSTNCKKLGECFYDVDQQGSFGLCVASDSECEASQICKEFGKCTAGRDRFCIVDSDEDCAQSEVCTQKGRCTAKKVKRADGKTSKIKSCQMK